MVLSYTVVSLGVDGLQEGWEDYGLIWTTSIIGKVYPSPALT